jgi:hypothetical protein
MTYSDDDWLLRYDDVYSNRYLTNNYQESAASARVYGIRSQKTVSNIYSPML